MYVGGDFFTRGGGDFKQRFFFLFYSFRGVFGALKAQTGVRFGVAGEPPKADTHAARAEGRSESNRTLSPGRSASDTIIVSGWKPHAVKFLARELRNAVTDRIPLHPLNKSRKRSEFTVFARGKPPPIPLIFLERHRNDRGYYLHVQIDKLPNDFDADDLNRCFLPPPRTFPPGADRSEIVSIGCRPSQL